MSEHRVRLNDAELLLVVAALRARSAGLTGARRLRTQRLADRLQEMTPGNPNWMLIDGAASEDARRGENGSVSA